MRSFLLRLVLLSGALQTGGVWLPASAQSYKVNNLISDGSVAATVTDPNFLNPWAISASPTWWISTANSGFNYVVSSAGAISFKVVVPAASGLTTATGLPAGSVTTAGAAGMVLPNGTKASFLFSTLDGTISGWNSKLGTANAVSQIAINNSAAGASYPGLALLNVNATTSYLLAANFGTGNAVEVYDSNFKAAKLAGSFTDPSLPTGYAPFSIHILGTQVFVNYALRTATAPYRTVDALGNGVVSVFDVNGNFVARAVTGGNLNSPWGIAIAPANFGIFSNDLLVGNFGDGKINVYDPKTYAYLGQMIDSAGKVLVYATLWELLPGGTTVGGTTAVSGGDASTVYFTAGLAGETHGLFAGISNGTTAGSTPTISLSTSSGSGTTTAGGAVQTTFSLAPVNGFSGAVSLTCSGLPAGSTCTFSPSQVTLASTAVSTGTVMIQTTQVTAALSPLRRDRAAGFTFAALLPFASLWFFRRRPALHHVSGKIRLLSLLTLLLVGGGLITGCSNDGAGTTTVATPKGTTTVTITATAGAVSQQTSFGLVVQ